MSEVTKVKLRAGSLKIPVTIIKDSGRLYFEFGFNRPLMEEIKVMAGSRYHGFDPTPRKVWSVDDCPRNQFQLQYLAGENPYSHFDQPLKDYKPTRPLYKHQVFMVQNGITYHYNIWAAEMGVGKTLSAIELMEASNRRDWFWVGPKSALDAATLEFRKWGCSVKPYFCTYEALKSIVTGWQPGYPPPHGVIFDESSRVKNHTSQRSQAAQHLADSIRTAYGFDGFVIEMSGSPAPKSPVDWWSQCLSLDTWIQTTQGLKQAKELLNQSCTVVLNGQKYKSETGTFLTGKKLIFEVRTTEGYSFKATADHRVLCDFDGLTYWKTVSELHPGMKICLSNNQSQQWFGHGDAAQGYILGLLIGDGCVVQRSGTVSGFESTLKFWPTDYSLIPFVLSLLGETRTSRHADGAITIATRKVDKIREEFSLDSSKQVSPLIESGSSEFLEWLIAGLFDTDGNVEPKRLRITIAQSDFDRLQSIQRILLALGIPSKIRLKELASEDTFQGRKIQRKDAWVLIISGEHVKTFYKRIPIQNPNKQGSLERNLGIKSQMSQKFVAEITGIHGLGEESVCDINVPVAEAFSGNGVILHNCEIAWPGYLREGRIDKFRTRLALIQQAEALSGGMFPKLVTWWDDENKCKVCGQPKEHPLHDVVNMCEHGYHGWVKSTNEVQYLYERMKGLVLVCFKKDCLDLPEKQYRLIFCPPSRETMNVMQGIVASAKSTITGLTLLRELSDGFQYKEVKTGEEVCDACHGERTAEEEVYVGPTYDAEELAKVGVTDPALHPANAEHPEYWTKQVGACSRCKGSGKIPSYTREAVPIDSPKYDALENLLDEHEDVGRIVIYGGFTGTIERIVKTCAKLGWYIIKADGQGWWSDIAVGGTMIYNHAQLLEIFQAPAMLREKRQPLEQWNRYLEEFPKVAFIGQPGASGMGLTLTASPSIVYVSNDFNAESRIQSEDRIHRPGMDVNRGATIIDLIHLPSDKLVLDNLQKKRDLQSMTLGVVKAAIMAAMQSTERRV